MKKAFIAAAIVGAAAAGVIVYLTNRNRAQQLLDDLNDTAQEGRKIASRYLRKTQKKVNHMLHENME